MKRQFPRSATVAVVLSITLAGWALTGATHAASVNVQQTFVNNTGQAANGLDWYFAPDTTVSNTWSNVFTTIQTTHYAAPPATPTPPVGATSAMRIRYTGGTVNAGGAGSATVGATIGSGSSLAYAALWLDNLSVPIGPASLPFSFGGSTTVQVGTNDTVWNTRIDNPNSTTVMLIDSLEYALTSTNLTGPALGAFSPALWTPVGTSIAVNPGDEFEFDTSAIAAGELVVVNATISLDGIPDSESQIRFQLVPEPGALAILIVGAGLLTVRRRR